MTFETWLKEDKFRTQVTLPFKEYLKEGLRKEPHELPDRPTPALKTGRETSKERAETRRARRENTPEGHPVCVLLWGVQIGDGCTTRREDWGAEETGEEAEGHQHDIVGSERSRDLEQDEGGESEDVHGHAANRYLA